MRFFLKLKHWQLFLLIISTPVALNILQFTGSSDTEDLSLFFAAIPIMFICSSYSLLGWIYSVGVNLHAKLPPGANIKLQRFKTLMMIPIVYITVLSIFLFLLFTGSIEWEMSPAIVLIIIAMHLLSMFGIFHSLYIAAKSLKAVELQRPVVSSDFSGEFFMFWIFFVGVWILQPRINKIFKEEDPYNAIY